MRPSASEVNGICSDATADFEDFLAPPGLEVGKTRNVILDEILTGLDLVEVLLCADGSSGVANVAGPRVPVIANARDVHFSKRHGSSIANASSVGLLAEFPPALPLPGRAAGCPSLRR